MRSRHLTDGLQRCVEALSDEDRGTWYTHTGSLQLLLEELGTRLDHIDLMQAQRIDPLLHVMLRRSTHEHGFGRHGRLAEDDEEAIRLSSFLRAKNNKDSLESARSKFMCDWSKICTYRFAGLLDDEIVHGLELLGHHVVLALHVAHFEVDQACVTQDHESLLPATEESR